MLSLLFQLMPIFIYFGLGLLMRWLGIANKDHGSFLLRFVFFVTLPLLVLTSIPGISFTAGKALLPVVNISVNSICLLATLLVIRWRKLERRTAGAMLVSTAIANNSFMFPFILLAYGQAGFADAILLDFGNAMMMATWIYVLAFRYGGKEQGDAAILYKVLTSPLVWSLLLSVFLALSGLSVPVPVLEIIDPLAQMTGPLILVALGIMYTLETARLPLALLTAGIRMGAGVLAGLALASLLQLEGVTRNVVILCSAAPIGFNALTYCSLARLDVELGASAVSLSILAGLVYIPVIIMLLGGI